MAPPGLGFAPPLDIGEILIRMEKQRQSSFVAKLILPWLLLRPPTRLDLSGCEKHFFCVLSFFQLLFFQFLKGFVTHTPPVCCADLPVEICLQFRQKAPSVSSSYTNQLNCFSQLLEYFRLLETVLSRHCCLVGDS